MSDASLLAHGFDGARRRGKEGAAALPVRPPCPLTAAIPMLRSRSVRGISLVCVFGDGARALVVASRNHASRYGAKACGGVHVASSARFALRREGARCLERVEVGFDPSAGMELAR